MADFCTCGAELPSNARFCHMCGKPQREEDVAQPEPAALVQAPPLPPPPLADLEFRNGAAVRAGFLAAFVSLLLNVLVPLPAVAPTVGGFFSVYLYRRRTGQAMSVLSGARMGCITGIILFLMTASMVVLALLAISNFPGGAQGLADQMQHAPVPVQKEVVDQFVQLIQQPSKVVLLLAGAFLMFSISTIAGGAIGGKLVGKADSGTGRSRV